MSQPHSCLRKWWGELSRHQIRKTGAGERALLLRIHKIIQNRTKRDGSAAGERMKNNVMQLCDCVVKISWQVFLWLRQTAGGAEGSLWLHCTPGNNVVVPFPASIAAVIRAQGGATKCSATFAASPASQLRVVSVDNFQSIWLTKAQPHWGICRETSSEMGCMRIYPTGV